MENETHPAHTPKSSSNKTLPIIIIVIIILLLAGGYYYWQHKQAEKQQAMMMQQHTAMNGMPGKGGKPGAMGHMNMQPQPTPTMSAQQQTEITAGTDTSSTEKTFHINGGNFYFTPNNITVNKGDKVTLVMTNDGGFHNIDIDEYNVKSSTIQTGQSTTVTFTADKAGSFVYYCSVRGHRQNGMWGTLTVK